MISLAKFFESMGSQAGGTFRRTFSKLDSTKMEARKLVNLALGLGMDDSSDEDEDSGDDDDVDDIGTKSPQMGKRTDNLQAGDVFLKLLTPPAMLRKIK